MMRSGSGDVPLVDAGQRSALLRIARRALERFVERGDSVVETGDGDVAPDLLLPRAVFVTLRGEGGRLRGCIGTVDGAGPLAEDVQRCVMSAAVDPRFEPIAPGDVKRTRIEISVLGPMSRVNGPEEIEAGRHGVMVSKSWKRGLLLPQVAREQGWDSERLLEEGCMKAGLARNAWRQGAAIEIFTAEVFGEEALSVSAVPLEEPGSLT